MKLKIEHNVPLPTGKQAVEGILPLLRGTINTMQVGDSFVWNGRASDVYRACPDKTLLTRRMENGDVRVWLVSMSRPAKKRLKNSK